MYRTALRTIWQPLLLTCGALCIPAAHAQLGADAASISADAVQLHGVLQPASGAPLAMAVITTDNGIFVREFLDSTGTVVAVTWSGPAVPDLRGLLGDYFSAYTAGLSALANAGRQRAIRIVTADLVVQADGHLRAFSGLAYLPARLPYGVSPQSLRLGQE